MDKPVAAIERMRAGMNGIYFRNEILAYLDSIPDGAVCVVWPKELTRERLEELAKGAFYKSNSDALRALAAIVPVRKKRMVNLWQKDAAGLGQRTERTWLAPDSESLGFGWRKVNREPIEIEE